MVKLQGFVFSLVIALLVTFVIATESGAQSAPRRKAKSQRGVVVEDATIFKEPHFESEVMANAAPGQEFDISIGKKGPFYKIRLRPGLTGWISDAEIVPKSAMGKREPRRREIDPLEPPAERERGKVKPVSQTRYRGLVLESINYTEDTMGKIRSASLLFYGMRWSGPNAVMAGDFYTDGEILFHFGAPGYYQDATGFSASGFIVVGNFMFVTEIPQSRDLMAFYGFGPTFKFSQFQTALRETSGSTDSRSYELTDATIGAVFGAGVALALGERYAVRLDGRYYWETQRYMSLSLAVQMEF